jgi:hypothetical protein
MIKLLTVTALLLLAACVTPTDEGLDADAGSEPQGEARLPSCSGTTTLSCSQWNATHTGCDQRCVGVDAWGCKILRWPTSSTTCGSDGCRNLGCDGAGSCNVLTGAVPNGNACMRGDEFCGIYSCYAGACTTPECAIPEGWCATDASAYCAPGICAEEYCE